MDKVHIPSTWITSDTHFCHRKIAHDRGFDTLEKMHEKLILNWNAVVKNTDTVIHLGDVGWFKIRKPTSLDYLLDRLNGAIILVLGNHDTEKFVDIESAIDFWLNRPKVVKVVLETELWKPAHSDIVLTHEPLKPNYLKEHKLFNIHGHTHSTWQSNFNSLSVTVDQNNLSPIPLGMAIAKVKNRIAQPTGIAGSTVIDLVGGDSAEKELQERIKEIVLEEEDIRNRLVVDLHSLGLKDLRVIRRIMDAVLSRPDALTLEQFSSLHISDKHIVLIHLGVDEQKVSKLDDAGCTNLYRKHVRTIDTKQRNNLD